LKLSIDRQDNKVLYREEIMGFEAMREKLLDWKSRGLAVLKSGTEAEDMTFDEIAVLRSLTLDILPLYVKIGGPEARNDIRELDHIGVDGLIAPMVESAFALKKFNEALLDILTPSRYHQIVKVVNLETITAAEHLESILDCEVAKVLHQVTAARTDLSASMGMKPDDTPVMKVAANIVLAARRHGLRTSVGGAIRPASLNGIIGFISPDWINTRHLAFTTDALAVGGESFLEEALHFEMELYAFMEANARTDRSLAFRKRIEVIESRLGVPAR
jgi:hypothetical protein